MPGNVLDDGQDGAGEEPVADRAAQRRDALGRAEKARAPITACVRASATSSTGAQSTVIPTSRKSWAMSRAASHAARAGSLAASKRAAAG